MIGHNKQLCNASCKSGKVASDRFPIWRGIALVTIWACQFANPAWDECQQFCCANPFGGTYPTLTWVYCFEQPTTGPRKKFGISQCRRLVPPRSFPIRDDAPRCKTCLPGGSDHNFVIITAVVLLGRHAMFVLCFAAVQLLSSRPSSAASPAMPKKARK